ncbi:MAG: UbiX family flavin prenyltransferase [Bacteroidota bacterium]|nr:UbiX family flavin prenyltransferase [Bacteroidota bacterium]
MKKIKIVLGVAGASGSIYAKRIIEKLNAERLSPQVESAGLVFSSNAKDIWRQELGEFNESAFKMSTYHSKDFNAPFASGSAGFDVLIIAPCSMGVLGRIASGVSSDLITRAADVMLKERKKLILLLREMPYSLVHLENMTKLTRAGAVIYPASPHFYHRPQTISELVDTVVNRVLETAGFDTGLKRWSGIEQ